jgi:multidrug efflux system outer membrane protein
VRRLCVIALLVASGGCATVGPDYKRPGIELPAAYPAGTPQAQAPAVAPDWWTLYNDRTLDSLITEARKNNADIRLAAARVQEAEAVLREAGAAIFPDVSGGYSATRSKVSTRSLPPPPATAPLTRTTQTLQASTAFEIDFWGRFSRATEAARANLLSADYSRDVVTLTLTGTTAQAYFGLRSLDAQIAVLDLTIRVRRDSLAIARARADAGIAPELDVHQAQGALSDALVQRRDAERQRALLERQIGQLAGRLDVRLPPEKLAGDLFSLPIPPTPPPGLPSALLERRPDVRSAEAGMVAANAQIGVAKAALFPALSLTAALGAQSAELATLLSSGAGIWTLGFGLALPLFDGGRREARVEQAEARREQALAGYQRSIETAFREVSDALVNVEQSGGSEADLEARLKAARAALELSTIRYESGYSPYLEVLDAQRTANEAELAFVRNRQARLAFSVDLMKALGGGWVDRTREAKTVR